ncbi:MAG: GTPase Era [Ignavibacteriales bacterium]|nr:MAG: GTPase Era [Ignavibacteriales bacterium]
MKTKTGYVAIIGKPNAGKSTLLNALLGQKLSIVNKKPQTTRKRILGILSEDEYQIIFLDTPGVLEPSYLLQKKMMESVTQSVVDADLIILIFDVTQKIEENEQLINSVLEKNNKPVILVLNKIDLSQQDKILTLINSFEKTGKYKAIIPASAAKNFNVDSVKTEIINLLPEGPKLYPDDSISDANERFFVSEIIREKILELFQDEVPYSCEVQIVDFKEREDRKDFIQAEIIVERDSQKIIIVGKQGEGIKKIGKKSREEIEKFLERPVFLELRVKVRKKWRSDEKMLKQFGYDQPDE